MQLSGGASTNGHLEILALALSLFYSYDENTVRQTVKDITFWSRFCCSSSSCVNGIELSQLLHPHHLLQFFMKASIESSSSFSRCISSFVSYSSFSSSLDADSIGESLNQFISADENKNHPTRDLKAQTSTTDNHEYLIPNHLMN